MSSTQRFLVCPLQPVFGVELIEGFYANGILGCTFIRKKNAVYANNAISGRKKRAVADGTTFFDLATEWYMFFAHGDAIDGKENSNLR